jgi:hemerythrin-like domain-containing protein
MVKKTFQTRRDFMLTTGAVGFSLYLTGAASFALVGCDLETEEKEISAVEDLMREHGALRRVLLIYAEIRQRLAAATEMPVEVVSKAAGIMKNFVGEYHEKLEENEVFPHFEKAGKMVDLVKVLRLQHEAGRRVTTHILTLATPAALADPASRSQLAEYLYQFEVMYRPHAAWEDTVLFPAFPALLSEDDYEDLGERFEKAEKKRFGNKGFENIVNQIAGLEKQLNINDLSRFTPKD